MKLRLWRIGAPLLGGVVVTVLLAWRSTTDTVIGSRLITYIERLRSPSNGEGEGWLSARLYEMPGQVRWYTVAAAPGYPIDGGFEKGSPEDVVPSPLRPLILPWVAGGRPWPPPGASETVYTIAGGWPVPALFAVRTEDAAGAQWSRVIRWRTAGKPAGWPLNITPGIPTGVLWRGFAFDSLLFACLFSLIGAAVSLVRVSSRRSCGLCTACAYPVGTSPVCTECGRPVKPKAVAA